MGGQICRDSTLEEGGFCRVHAMQGYLVAPHMRSSGNKCKLQPWKRMQLMIPRRSSRIASENQKLSRSTLERLTVTRVPQSNAAFMGICQRGWTCFQYLESGKQSSRQADHICRLELVILAVAHPKKQMANMTMRIDVAALLPVA